MMNRSSILRVLAYLLETLIVTGCEAPNVFRNELAQRPHATLVSENPPGWRGFMSHGRNVSPFFINNQPTAFWRMRDHFRLPLGKTILEVSDVCKPYHFEPIRFSAVTGRHYILRPTRIGTRDAATLSERAPGTGTERVIATALRDDP